MPQSDSSWPALTRALAARQRSARVLAIVVLVLAIGLTGGLYAISDPGEGRVGRALVKGGIMIVGGLVYAAWAFTHRPHKHKLFTVLTTDPSQVVWIYKHMVNGVANVAVGLRNKKKIFVPTEEEGLFEEVWAEILAVAPHANQGYSERKDTVFRQDPVRLLGAEAEAS